MKRSGPPARRTPLPRSTKPIARTRIRTKPRPPEDRVSPELHAHVLTRDGRCIGILLRDLAIQMPDEFGDLRDRIPWHQCATQWGEQHDSDDLTKLTADHFWHDGGHTGDRAPSKPEHLVACCGWLNVGHITKAIREGERRYIEWRQRTGRGL